MSHEKISSTHGIPNKDNTDKKSKPEPGAENPATQPGKTPAEVAPATKS